MPWMNGQSSEWSENGEDPRAYHSTRVPEVPLLEGDACDVSKEAVFGGQVAVTKSESQWCHIGTQPRSTTENLGEPTDRRESGALSEAGW